MYRVSKSPIAGPSPVTHDTRSSKGSTAAKVIQSFNTWSFKREQPSDAGLLARIVGGSVDKSEPVPFVLYWGKGPRSRIAAPDLQCLDYLAALSERISSAYPMGTSINLVFTDTHAELNGHPRAKIDCYYADIRHAASERDFHCHWLKELTQAALALDPVRVEEPVSADTLDRLAQCAERWYQGEGSPKDGALKYYRMNMLEKRAIEFAFPHSIFITFNGSEFRELFPDRLPVFYMYSLKRGIGVKPWFLAEDSRPFGADWAIEHLRAASG